MTPNPLAPRYGRAGGPSTQMIKETADITVTGLSFIDAGTSSVLMNASSVTGNAESYYLIWGWTVVHSDDNPVYGYLESNEGTPENITPFAVTAAGPISQALFMPIKIAEGKGVQVRALNSPAGVSLVAVHYTVHTS
tara:strand:+ start:4579 stop:4989 length:411 start_codon:yes stop_codon:yes gene_type:complete